MALITLTEAATLAARGRPWSVRLEFQGPNPNNQGGMSSKFWSATGRGLNEPVEMGWGALGSTTCQTLLGDFAGFRDKLNEKLGKGYQYVSAPYQRMSPANLALCMNKPPAAAPVTPPAPVPPVAKRHQHATGAQMALGFPYSLICSFRVTHQPKAAPILVALDAQGVVLMDMALQDGVAFAREYKLDIIWV